MRFTRQPSKRGGLLLTRKEGETVLVNNGEIEIEVVQITDKEVRLGFHASRDIRLQRGETVSTDAENISRKR